MERLSIDNNEIEHSCNTYYGSSGSPILNLNNNKVFGIHKGGLADKECNVGRLLKFGIDKFKEKYNSRSNNFNRNKSSLNVVNNKRFSKKIENTSFHSKEKKDHSPKRTENNKEEKLRGNKSFYERNTYNINESKAPKNKKNIKNLKNMNRNCLSTKRNNINSRADTKRAFNNEINTNKNNSPLGKTWYKHTHSITEKDEMDSIKDEKSKNSNEINSSENSRNSSVFKDYNKKRNEHNNVAVKTIIFKRK